MSFDDVVRWITCPRATQFHFSLFFTALTSHHWLNGKKWFHGARAKQNFKKKLRLLDSPISVLHRFLTSNELI